MNDATIYATRLHRQQLGEPVSTKRDYLRLFTELQPVPPVYFSRPGDPPRLVHRAMFDDGVLTGRWRERREIVKGRFQGGTIAYVREDELALYANAYCRPMTKWTWQQRMVFDALQQAGPLTPRQLKEETDLLNKEIMPALHRLQEAFLVYEDQVDCDWERGWYVFVTEWPEVTVAPERWEGAAAEVLRRFFAAVVFATDTQCQDWSGWSGKDVKRLLARLAGEGCIVPCTVDGLGSGWICTEDTHLPAAEPPPGVFMLHKSDPLVRMHQRELKARYAGREVLQYLLIDGAIQGAVLGHWRIGPHAVEDIVVDLPAAARTARRDEIIAAVAWGYQPPFSHIVRYDGVER